MTARVLDLPACVCRCKAVWHGHPVIGYATCLQCRRCPAYEPVGGSR